MVSVARSVAIATGIAVMPFGCRSQAPESTEIVERLIAPQTVNTNITQWGAEHHVWLPARAAQATQMMLFLPGTGGRPDNARLIGAIAAGQGYRVVGLMYPDDRAVVNECSGDPDTDCMAKMRAEIIQGGDQSPHVTVDRDNSIDGRLADLIAYLAQTYPGETWGSFLNTDGTPRWERIAVSGLSQGGGHAAYIAKLRAVPRVVMFGAPADGYQSQIAPWMQIGATPASRYYGFRHSRDPFTSIQPNWVALGLEAFGPAKEVLLGTTTFDGSHMLVTDILPGTGSYNQAHPSVFADGATPLRANGTPVFDSAWRYLLGTGGQ